MVRVLNIKSKKGPTKLKLQAVRIKEESDGDVRPLNLKGSSSKSSSSPTSLNIGTSNKVKTLGLQRGTSFDIPEDSPIYKKFSKSDINRIKGIASLIDIHNTSECLEYAMEQQQALSSFTDAILDETLNANKVEVSLIKEVIKDAKELDLSVIAVEDNFFRKTFGFIKTREELIESLINKFHIISARMSDAVDDLIKLLDDLLYKKEVLDDMYNENLKHYKELNIYIAAAKLRIAERKKILEEEKYEISSSDDIALHEWKNKMSDIESFERKVHSLSLQRLSVLQTVPQIQLMQTNNKRLIEKIDNIITTVIPLWKKQFITAINMANHKDLNIDINSYLNSLSGQIDVNSIKSDDPSEVIKNGSNALLDIVDSSLDSQITNDDIEKINKKAQEEFNSNEQDKIELDLVKTLTGDK